MLQDGLHRKFITCYDAVKKAMRVTIGNETDEVRITNGGLDVNIQDQFTEIIDLHLSQLMRKGISVLR